MMVNIEYLQTLTSTRLGFENFAQPFITHGIDVITDPEDSTNVYILAVTHPPNPDYYKQGVLDTPKAASKIEIFHHTLGTKSGLHVRSVEHPLIRTPNDIYAESPTSFYVTNDFWNREGLARLAELLIPVIEWGNVVHVQMDDLSSNDVHVVVSLDRVRYPNGLGHGRQVDKNGTDEIMLVSAIDGKLSFMKSDPTNHALSFLETVLVPGQIDNPSYYSDPFDDDDDASGYIVTGMPRPIDILRTATDPDAKDGTAVWYLRRTGGDGWEKRLLFEDDGTNIRAGSVGVLVPIVHHNNASVDATKKGPGKEAWLFVSGILSEAMLAVRVAL